MDAVAVPAGVADQARAALAERSRLAGLEGASRQSVLVAMELAQAPFVPEATLALVGAWHAANPNATTHDGRCTRLAGLYGGAEGKRWALDHSAIPVVSWLPEESATLEAMTAAPTNTGGMIALFPDEPDQLAIDGGEQPDQLHVTLAFVAEDAAALTPPEVAAIEAAAQAGAAVRSAPLLLRAVGAGTLGDSDPPAVVVFLQQSDGDGTDHLDGVAAIADAVRTVLDNVDDASWPAEHDAFIPHMTISYGGTIADAQALIGTELKFSTGPTVVLGDIRQPHDWTGQPAATPDAATAAVGDPLTVMGQKAQRARDRLEERLIAAAQVAMRDAMRRAGVKITQRASRRSKASKDAVAAANGQWTPAVLAAVGMTEADLIRQAFDSLGERYEQWVIDAAAEQLRAVASVLGFPPDEVLARMRGRMGDIAKAARLQLNENMTQWAYRLLAEPVPSFGDVGEVPVDPTMPRAILQPSLTLADGRKLASDGDPSGDGLLLEAWLTFDANAPVEVVEWVCGDPARPFPPHHDLCGSKTMWSDYAGKYAAEVGSFPRGESYWFPGDHNGCVCDYAYSYITAAEAGLV